MMDLRELDRTAHSMLRLRAQHVEARLKPHSTTRWARRWKVHLKAHHLQAHLKAQ